MRALQDYTRQDWKHLRPLTHAYKSGRYRAVNAIYVRKGATRLGSLRTELAADKPDGMVFSVAFETPWVIAWQIEATRQNLADAMLVICDNSRTDIRALEIERTCKDTGTPYIRLPPNRTRAASRSHALALNWIYRNIVRKLDLRYFGFIDHDLVPVEPVSLRDYLGDQPFYGMKRWIAPRWFLWAGYCVFDHGFACANDLDFSQDWFYGLDTGGANWRRVYRRYDATELRFADVRYKKMQDSVTGTTRDVFFVDQWLHVTNASRWDREARDDSAFYQGLAKVLTGHEALRSEAI